MSDSWFSSINFLASLEVSAPNKQVYSDSLSKGKGNGREESSMFEFIMFWKPAGIYALFVKKVLAGTNKCS